jgi:PAB1-binding protein PBP1
MVSQKKLPNSADILNGAGKREQATMSFQRKEITEARVVPGNGGKGDGKITNGTRDNLPSLELDLTIASLGNRPGFKTDSSISNTRLGGERELKRWVPDSNDDTSFSLEQPTKGPVWDQFATNEQLFGVKSDYDENIYTTAIDKAHPDYNKRVGYADRKAREIERSAATTSHVAEERVMDFVGGEDHRDEEEKYAVLPYTSDQVADPHQDTVAYAGRTSRR